MENIVDISEPQATTNEPSVYSVSMGEKQFLKLNKLKENWIYWSFPSFGGTWGPEIFAKFSVSSHIHAFSVTWIKYS